MWVFAAQVVVGRPYPAEATAKVIVSLSGGALFANVVSVTLLVIETVSFQRIGRRSGRYGGLPAAPEASLRR